MRQAGPLLAVLMAEAVVGYPGWLHHIMPHPVVWVGRSIAMMDRAWNRGAPLRRRGHGIGAVLLLVVVPAGVGFLLQRWLVGWAGFGLLVLVATTGLAQRSLYRHVRAVERPLREGLAGEARRALSMIVGRDVESLDEAGIVAAATESLAESFCDGVVAPAFWFLVAGLPGLFAFKAVSTADSLIGHKDVRYRQFGWAAARADDVMNLIPARVAGLLICLAGTGGWRVMWRDADRHLSPNAGWPEAAMAGALGVQLGGGAAYDGEWIGRAQLGQGERPGRQALQRALRLYRRACLLLWVAVGALIWVA